MVEVVLDAERTPISGALYARGSTGWCRPRACTASSRCGSSARRLAGRLFVDGPHEFDGVRWAYDVTFRAAIPRPPTADELAADLASPPGVAASAWLAAARAGRMEAVLPLLAPALAADWTGAAGRTRLAHARADTQPDSRVVSLTRPTATTAIATVHGTRASDGIVVETTFELALVDGAWKITR